MKSNGRYRPERQAIGFVAVVHTPDSVTFAATAGTRAALVQRIAEYVGDVVNDRLLPSDATLVRKLIASGQLDRGIERYFELVGARWDEEWLVTAAIADDMSAAAIADVDTVVSGPTRFRQDDAAVA